MKKIGLITIGQSPRTDVVPELRKILGDSNVEIIECGALDRLSNDEITALRPAEGEYVLVTRLRDGTEVKIARDKILPLLQGCIDSLEPLVDVLGLLCTGEFPELRSRKMLIEPSNLLLKVVESLKVSRLGVIIPDPKQIDLTKKKWHNMASDLKILSISPYTGSLSNLKSVAETLQDRDLIVLDCIGFSTEAKKIIATISGKPVILPRTLMARVLRELLEV